MWKSKCNYGCKEMACWFISYAQSNVYSYVFPVVEWDYVDRVMLQLEMTQKTLIPYKIDMKLYWHDLRGRHEGDWIRYLIPQLSYLYVGMIDKNWLFWTSSLNKNVDIESWDNEWYSNISMQYIMKERTLYDHLIQTYCLISRWLFLR